VVNLERYSYIQANVQWTESSLTPVAFESISKVLKELQSTVKDDCWNSLLFKQNILQETISRYLPIVSSEIRGYFNTSNRDKFASNFKKVQKQKKLTRFFGEAPTIEHMDLQQVVIDQGLGDENDKESIASDGNDHKFDKRKRAGKLADFFGDEPAHKKEIMLAFSEAGNRNPDDEQLLEVLKTTNEIPKEEKKIMIKKAKKLLLILGENVEEQVSRPPVTKNEGNSSFSLHISPSRSSISSIASEISADDKERINEKQRLDKLMHFLGHRIEARVLEEAKNNVLSRPQIRPLTDKEKKTFQRRSSKLESMFGTAVPFNSILNYNTLDEEDESPMNPSNSFIPVANVEAKPDNKKKQKLDKIKKIHKILGVNVYDDLQNQLDMESLRDSIASISDLKLRSQLLGDLELLGSLDEEDISDDLVKRANTGGGGDSKSSASGANYERFISTNRSG
jgi:hypothetical protein